MQLATPPFFLAGETSALMAAWVWTISLIGFRAYGRGIPARTLNLYKNLVATTLIAASLFFLPFVAVPWESLGWLGLSGFIGIAVGDTAFFGALSRLGAQVTAVSQCLCPAVAAIVAWWVFGESLTSLELIGMAITMAGIAGVLLFGGHRRQVSELDWGSGILLATLSAVCNGVGVVIARSALQGVDIFTGTFARVGTALIALFMLDICLGKGRFQWKSLFSPPKRAWVLGVCAFLGAYLGLLFMSGGVKYAKAGVATGINMTYPLWVIPFAVFGLKEKTSLLGVVCAVVAVLGVALMFIKS